MSVGGTRCQNTRTDHQIACTSGCGRSALVRCLIDERALGLGIACMLICMQSTSVRIDAATHEDLKRLAAELHTTVGNTVSLAVRALRQNRVGADLTAPLREDESAWLDADLG